MHVFEMRGHMYDPDCLEEAFILAFHSISAFIKDYARLLRAKGQNFRGVPVFKIASTFTSDQELIPRSYFEGVLNRNLNDFLKKIQSIVVFM